jgi:hypothetical protein
MEFLKQTGLTTVVQRQSGDIIEPLRARLGIAGNFRGEHSFLASAN